MRQIFTNMGTVAVVVVCAISAHSGTALAVEMPKEGSFEFDLCGVVLLEGGVQSDQLSVVHYSLIVNTLTEPAGRPFDQQSVRCWSTAGTVAGKAQEVGYCEAVDQDGERWYAEYHGNVEGTGGSYTAVHGTGKYAGMTLNGEYSFKYWPSTSSDTAHICNPNKGTYKLAQ